MLELAYGKYDRSICCSCNGLNPPLTLNLKISSGLRPSLSAPQAKRTFYGAACYFNMSVRKICVFLFVNRVFIFRIANTFVASYAMKYSEIFFVIRKFVAPPPPPPPNYTCLATALV
jgi:hypothetical protein